MNKKLIGIMGGAAALVAIIVACIFIFAGGKDEYRSIKVFEIDGTCMVERDGDTLDAFKNMALSSGDTLTVGDGSFTRLKLDDDKYVYLEAGTKISLTATGTANDSKTAVYIECGSMLTEVKKKLSATSSYDIVTPNTTMSIRGTKTLTEVIKDALGKIKTSAAVIEGFVKFQTVQKDKNGKTKFVTNDLSVGQGLSIQTEEKDLVSDEDMKSFAETGKTSDGTTVEETSHEELGSDLGAATFSDEFLNNAADVLERSAEEDRLEAEENGTDDSTSGTDGTDGTGSDAGASALAALSVLNDMKESGGAEVPADVSDYVQYVSGTYYGSGYGTDAGEQTDPAVSEPVNNGSDITDANGNDPAAAENDDDTFVVDGNDTSLVVIGEDEDDGDDENGADAADEDEEDENNTADGEDGSDENDNTGDGNDADNDNTGDEDDGDDTENAGADENDGEDEGKDTDGETEEERLAREEKERLEKEEAERLEKEEQEKKEREESEAAEAAEREEAERLAREQAERLAREQAERDAQQEGSGGQTPDTSGDQDADSENDNTDTQGSSSSDSGATASGQEGTGSGGGSVQTVSYSDSHWDYTTESRDQSGTTVSRASWSVRPVYRDSNNNVVSYSSLPTTPGTPLPGSSGSNYTVTLDVTGDIPSDTRYEFAGWYRSSLGATECRESERVTTVPSDGITLFPGIRAVSVTYTVRFVNLFPEAGTLTVPSQDSWGDYTYREDEDPEAEWVEITGIHSGDFIHFPMTSEYLSYYSINPGTCLHIEDHFNEIGNELTEFAGIGIGTKGSDGIVRGGDDINLARILLGDTDYADSVANDFVRYDTDITSDYMLDTEIRSDMTFYLYFSTAVTLTVPKGGNTPVRMLDSEGTADTATVLARYGFDYTQSDASARLVAAKNVLTGEHRKAAPQLLKLRSGSTRDKDQYWGVFLNYLRNDVDSDPIYVFKTYYFGNLLDIPAFEVDQSKASLYDLSAKLIVTGNQDVVPGSHAEKTYVNTPTSGVNALTISRTNQTSSWFIGNGRLVYNSLGFELDESRFVTLDISDSGASDNIGIYAQNLIRKHRDSEDGVFRLRVEKHIASGYYYNVALIPEDGGYDWASGGTRREVPPTDQNSTYLSKEGMRLAGYVVSYMDGQNEIVRNALVNQTYSAWPEGDDTVFLRMDPKDDPKEYIVKLEHVTSNRAYVLKPIFLPENGPFEIGIERKSGKIVRPTSAEVDWAISDYELTISGLKDMIDAGYPVSMIDLRSIRAKCYNYDRNNNAYYDVSLDKLLYWDATHSTYNLYVRGASEDSPVRVGGNSVRYTLQNDGTLRIPLKDLGDFILRVNQSTSLATEFVRGVGFADYDDPLNEYDIIQKFVSYQIESLIPNRDLGKTSGTPSSFARYTPCDCFAGIKANHDYRYTAVYYENGTGGPALVFNESGSEPISTSGYLLQLIAGIADDSYPGTAWYGGVLSKKAYSSRMLSDVQLASIFPRLVTRTESAAGDPEAVIKGSTDWKEKYGSGVLVLSKFKYLRITPSADMVIYSYDSDINGRIGDDSINTEGLESALVLTWAQFFGGTVPDTDQYKDLVLVSTTSVPNGWALVENGNGRWGYIYFGEASIAGKANATLSTNRPQ